MQCNTICVICVEQYTAGIGIVAPKCGHVFHELCLNKWLETSPTCPQCRKQVVKKNNIKLYFNFSSENSSSDNTGNLSDMLKEQLMKVSSQIEEKDKKIKELQAIFAEAERNVANMHQKQMNLEHDLSAMKRKLLCVNKLEATNQRLVHEKNVLKNEVEHLNNVKTVVEGSYNETAQITNDIIAKVPSEEGKIAVKQIAAYCCVIKRELNRMKEEKAQLHSEITKAKRKIGIIHANYVKKTKFLGRQLKQQEEFEAASSRGSNPISIIPDLQKYHLTQGSNIPKPTSTCCSDDNDSCRKMLTPISVDFPQHERQKISVVVVDKEIGKISTQAPETPVLRLVNSAMSAKQVSDNEDSVSRVGYNGLGGHGRIITGSAIKKAKLFRK